MLQFKIQIKGIGFGIDYVDKWDWNGYAVILTGNIWRELLGFFVNFGGKSKPTTSSWINKVLSSAAGSTPQQRLVPHIKYGAWTFCGKKNTVLWIQLWKHHELNEEFQVKLKFFVPSIN